MGKLEYFKELEYRLRGLPERERQNIIAVYEELFQKAEANGKSEQDIVDSLGFPRVPNWDAVYAQGAGPHSGAAGPARTPGVSGTPPQPTEGWPPMASGTAMPTGATGGNTGNASGRYATGPMRPPADPMRDPRSGFTPPASPLYQEPSFAPPPYRAPMGSGVKPWIAGLALAFFNLVFILGPYLGLCGVLLGLWATLVALVLMPIAGLIGTGIPQNMTTLLLLIFGSMASLGAALMLAVILQFVTKWFFKLTYKYIKFNWNIIKGA